MAIVGRWVALSMLQILFCCDAFSYGRQETTVDMMQHLEFPILCIGSVINSEFIVGRKKKKRKKIKNGRNDP
jgi:hypothetical protein